MCDTGSHSYILAQIAVAGVANKDREVVVSDDVDGDEGVVWSNEGVAGVVLHRHGGYKLLLGDERQGLFHIDGTDAWVDGEILLG